ncbi:hypothetical protein FXO37_10906 [Capsicum annuum]|nr:hypothetical protein FXO37_10906 [Capsicum annuum]
MEAANEASSDRVSIGTLCRAISCPGALHMRAIVPDILVTWNSDVRRPAKHEELVPEAREIIPLASDTANSGASEARRGRAIQGGTWKQLRFDSFPVSLILLVKPAYIRHRFISIKNDVNKNAIELISNRDCLSISICKVYNVEADWINSGSLDSQEGGRSSSPNPPQGFRTKAIGILCGSWCYIGSLSHRSPVRSLLRYSIEIANKKGNIESPCRVAVFLCGFAIAALGSMCHAPTVLLANFIVTPIELRY